MKSRTVGFSLGLITLCCLSSGLGCASSPAWLNTLDNPQEDSYWRAVGHGPTRTDARRDAFIRLSAKINGSTISETTQLYQQARSQVDNRRSKTQEETFLDNWIEESTQGSVPQRTRVVETFKDREGFHAYAVAEKAGSERQIQRALGQVKRQNRVRSLVPGWAQLTKREAKKGAVFVVGSGLGIVGGLVFKTLMTDAKARRNRARTPAAWDYENTMANRYYWSSTGFFALAGCSYLTSIIDGLYSAPKGYRLTAGLSTDRVYVTLNF